MNRAAMLREEIGEARVEALVKHQILMPEPITAWHDGRWTRVSSFFHVCSFLDYFFSRHLSGFGEGGGEQRGEPKGEGSSQWVLALWHLVFPPAAQNEPTTANGARRWPLAI